MHDIPKWSATLLLQDFQSVSDHFRKACIKRLTTYFDKHHCFQHFNWFAAEDTFWVTVNSDYSWSIFGTSGRFFPKTHELKWKLRVKLREKWLKFHYANIYEKSLPSISIPYPTLDRYGYRRFNIPFCLPYYLFKSYQSPLQYNDYSSSACFLLLNIFRYCFVKFVRHPCWSRERSHETKHQKHKGELINP